MFNQMHVKFGANPSPAHKLSRVLTLASYVDQSKLTTFVPPVFDWSIDVPDSVDRNDELGCCVVAAQAKMVRSWTANSRGKAVMITDRDIEAEYSAGAGYDPTNPFTDLGWDLLSGLSYWQRTGIAGHKIGPYTSVNPCARHMMRAATYLFGGLYVAFDLPASCESQRVWDRTQYGKSIGFHCVTIQGVDSDDHPICLTWGYRQKMTWEFVADRCFEAYAVMSDDYLQNGSTIAGLDVDRLRSDMRKITL